MTTKQEIIHQLKERISTMEWQPEQKITSYALGISEIDQALKHGGIVAGSCHEIICSHEGAALAFMLHLLSSMVQKKGPVLWCTDQQDFYTPGFLSYGLKDTDVIFAETQDYKQSLWAMEQGLLCSDFSAVVLCIKKLSLAQGRRIKLLTQKHGTTGILLIKPGAKINLPTIATTRWQIMAEPSVGMSSRNGKKSVGVPRLTINLIRNLGGAAPLSWTVSFDEDTLRFHTLPSFLSSTNQTNNALSLSRPRKRAAQSA